MRLNYFKDSEETVSAIACAGFCQWESLPWLLPSLFQGAYRVRDTRLSPGDFFFESAASQLPPKNCCAAAVGKIATRRLISRIILAPVVNASSRRRRGLRSCAGTGNCELIIIICLLRMNRLCWILFCLLCTLMILIRDAHGYPDNKLSG